MLLSFTQNKLSKKFHKIIIAKFIKFSRRSVINNKITLITSASKSTYSSSSNQPNQNTLKHFALRTSHFTRFSCFFLSHKTNFQKNSIKSPSQNLSSSQEEA